MSLAINFNNFSDFELPQVNNFSNFSDFRQNFRKRACRAQLSFWRKETLAQIADIEKVATGLRGLSGPAGGADFFGFACQNQRFPNDFYDQTISQGLGAGGAPNFRDFKAFEFLEPI